LLFSQDESLKSTNELLESELNYCKDKWFLKKDNQHQNTCPTIYSGKSFFMTYISRSKNNVKSIVINSTSIIFLAFKEVID
jgi:hypothetical protein